MPARFCFISNLLLLSLAAAAPAAFAQASKSPAPNSSPTHLEHTYAMIGGRPIGLDLSLPPSLANPLPLLIYIHGGGWAAGNKSAMPSPPAQDARSRLCRGQRRLPPDHPDRLVGD